jgi:hypothetical protein
VLVALIATVCALAALAVFGGRAANAHRHATTPTAHAASSADQVSQAELALREGMRKLWEDHVTWTRLAVISLTTDAPDTKATVARLLRNQADIGNAIVPFYGEAGGKELTRLLREHILVAADVIAAARANDAAKLAAEQAEWRRNADEIAVFLNGANPGSWKRGEMRAMLHAHLLLTTREVVARLQRNWAADVRAYDATHRQALAMADMLSEGIVRQFPGRFA